MIHHNRVTAGHKSPLNTDLPQFSLGQKQGNTFMLAAQSPNRKKEKPKIGTTTTPVVVMSHDRLRSQSSLSQ